MVRKTDVMSTTSKFTNTIHSPCAGLMLSHRRRRWDNIEPAHDERLVFTKVRARCRLDFEWSFV